MAQLICKPFQRGNEPLVYKDAICLTQDQWDNLLDGELEALQDQRYTDWLALINDGGN